MRTSTRARTHPTSSFAERARRAWGGSSPSARRSSARRTALELADQHPEVFAILGIHPHEASEDHDARHAPRAARAPACGRGRRDRPRLLSRLRPARPPARALPAAPRARRRAREAGRDPQPRRRRGRARGARVVRRNRRAALLLLSLRAAGRARTGVLRLVRRQRDVQERVGAARRRDAGPARPHPHRDRRPVPRARAAARAAERARERRAHAGGACAHARRRGGGARRRRSTRTPGARSVCRERRAEEGARPALPRRREHPRRDRPARRARRAATSCSRWVPGSAS